MTAVGVFAGTGRWVRLAAIPLAAALVAGGVAAAFAVRERPLYRSTSMVVVAPSSQLGAESDKLRALEALERRSILATLAKIPPTAEVRDAVALSLGVPVGELTGYAIRATVLPHAHVIAVEATGPDPARCAALAEAAAEATQRRVRRLYPVYTLRPLEAARPASAPFRPDVGRQAAAAAALGFFVGALAVAAWTALRGASRAPRPGA